MIRTVFALLLVLGAVSILAGCGSSGSNNSSDSIVPEEPTAIAMQIDLDYEVGAGDILQPTDEETRVAVRHVFAEDKKYVTLLAGGATLIKGVTVLP